MRMPATSSAPVDPGLKYLYKEDLTRRKHGQSSGTSVPDRGDEGLALGYKPETVGGVAELGPPSLQRMASRVEGGGSVIERWHAGLANLTEIGTSLSSLQNLLVGKAVYVDEDAFAQASAQANLFRMSKAQERRIRALERELDAAVSASGHARTEKKEAENAQRAAEERTNAVLQELEDTKRVLKVHLEELHAKQVEVDKKNAELKVLQAIIEALRVQPPQSSGRKQGS